jgi:hypothetical protein
MSVNAKLKLFQAIKAHTSKLEIERDNTTGLNREALDGRTEAARQLLEWLEQAREPEPSVFPAAQTPLPSS